MQIGTDGVTLGNGDAKDGPIVGEGSTVGGDSGGLGGHIVIDPAEIAGSAGTGDASGGSVGGGKRRGRKPGSRNATSKKASLDINGVSATLYSLHMMLAGLMATPELALDKQEAQLIAEASANVARHYDVGISQKAVDWTNLFGALGMVYGTRLFAVRAKRMKARAERAERVEPIVPDGSMNGSMNGANPFAPPPPQAPYN